MALNAAIDWEVRQDGNDLNGGGYKRTAGTTDYSQQAAAQKAGADLEMHASTNTKVKPTAAGVAAADVGNVIQISAGTNWTPGFYEITAQDGTYWTLDRSPNAAGDANLATYKMGGALANPGTIGGIFVSGNLIYLKYSATPYSISTATPNVAGGPLTLTAGGSTANGVVLVGYSTTRTVANDDADRPTLTVAVGVASITVVNHGTAPHGGARNIIVDGNAQTGIVGFANGTVRNLNHRCRAVNCASAGFSGTAGFSLACEADTCGAGFAHLSVGCWAHDCTGTGFSTTAAFCLANGNAAGFVNAASTHFFGCIAYANTGHGFSTTDVTGTFVNCIAEANGGWGFINVYSGRLLVACAAYNNATGQFSGGTQVNCVTVTAGSVFTNAAGGDFTLNTTADRGLLLRGAGFPGTFVNGTVGAADIGLFSNPDFPDVGNVRNNDTVNGVTGELNVEALEAAAYSAGTVWQAADDASFLEANKDEIIPADTDIEARFGVTGTAPAGGNVIVIED